MVVDIGTGSGSAVLRRATREPETLFVALDAEPRAMADVSRRAARPARKGGVPNVVFIAAAADELPGPLCGTAHEATIVLPWGSLLAAVLDPCGATFQGMRRVLCTDGVLTVLISALERDGIADTSDLDEHGAVALVDAYRAAGLECIELRAATRADVDRLSSGWGRRLGIPERRRAWLISLRQT